MEEIKLIIEVIALAIQIFIIYKLLTTPLKEINETLKELVFEIKRKNNEDKK